MRPAAMTPGAEPFAAPAPVPPGARLGKVSPPP